MVHHTRAAGVPLGCTLPERAKRQTVEILFVAPQKEMDERLARVWHPWAAPCQDQITFRAMPRVVSNMRNNKTMVTAMLDLADASRDSCRWPRWLQFASDSCAPVSSCREYLSSLSVASAAFLKKYAHPSPKTTQWITVPADTLWSHSAALREQLDRFDSSKWACGQKSCAPDEWVFGMYWQRVSLPQTDRSLTRVVWSRHTKGSGGHPITFNCPASENESATGSSANMVPRAVRLARDQGFHFMRKVPTACLPLVVTEVSLASR